MTTLLWQDLAVLGACHVARVAYVNVRSFALHNHDFAEICWVETGSVRHDTPRGSVLMHAGDGRLLRPEHRHGFRASAGGGILVNIALPQAVLIDVEARYQSLVDGTWPWAAGPEPYAFHLSSGDLAACTARVARLPAQPDALQRDAVVLDVLDRLRSAEAVSWPGLPSWLAESLNALADSSELAEGLPALVRRCGRSREHISRLVREAMGLRTIDVINDLRVQWAARELARSESSAQAIAAAIGFVNRTHFHTVFRKKFACTPAQYRRNARAAVLR